jgi:hypothetical protein
LLHQKPAELNPEGTLLIGTAEANAKIEVKSADGQTTLGSGTVGADGKFSLSLSPALTDKNIAKIYIIDSSGNRSEPTDVFGAKDTIKPTKPLLQTVMDDITQLKALLVQVEVPMIPSQHYQELVKQKQYSQYLIMATRLGLLQLEIMVNGVTP